MYKFQTSRGPDNLWRRDREAEGIEGEGNGEGVPPPQPTRGLGEHRKLPQLGPERSPGRKRVLVYFTA